jgi:hypothetical protein
MTTHTNIIDWVEKATPEQLALIESLGPDNIVRMGEELQRLKTGQADKNRALLKEFFDDHKQTIGFVVGAPIAILCLCAFLYTLYYMATRASREYVHTLDKVVECRSNAAGKEWDLEEVCGKIPQSPYSRS